MNLTHDQARELVELAFPFNNKYIGEIRIESTVRNTKIIFYIPKDNITSENMGATKVPVAIGMPEWDKSMIFGSTLFSFEELIEESASIDKLPCNLYIDNNNEYELLGCGISPESKIKPFRLPMINTELIKDKINEFLAIETQEVVKTMMR